MKDLFGIEVPDLDVKHPKANLGAAALHKQLISLYGEVDNRCKNCAHLQVRQFSGRYFKCLIATPNPTCNAKTDWRANWKACGKFEKEQ